jgi:integrase
MSGSGKVRGRMVLTPKAIEAFRPEAEPYLWRDIAALAIRVAPSGEKTWDVAYRIRGSGKFRRLSLGRYGDPGATLEKARTRTIALTTAAREGRDLIAAEEEAQEAKARVMTVGKLKELYLVRRVRGRLRSALEIERILNCVLEPLASMLADDVRRRNLLPLTEAIAAKGHKRAAGKARQIVSGMFTWAETREIVSSNPTRGLPSYDQGTPRDRVLSEKEIPVFWAWLESCTLSSAMADTLRVQLLTGARIGEITGMALDEIDQSEWLWTLPASRSKNKHVRTTPLVGIARQIVATRIGGAARGPLFPSVTGAPLTSAAIATALYNRRAGSPIEAFGTHDLRRTVATMMEELGIAENIIAKIVGHGAEDGGRSVRTLRRNYLKSELIKRKTHALEVWDARLRDIISGASTDNVVHLHHRIQ